MSSVLSTAINLVGGELQTILLKNGRSIAGIIPDVVVSEHHRDTLVVTGHPVEQGAEITDHAYKKPAEVTIVAGFSNAGGAGGGVVSSILAAASALSGGGQSLSDIYQQFLDLQENRQPFDLVTGKRSYSNMLLEMLEVMTDITKENILMITATFRQVIIVETQTTQLKPAAAMADPSSTASLINSGVKQAKSVASSALNSIVPSGVRTTLQGLGLPILPGGN